MSIFTYPASLSASCTHSDLLKLFNLQLEDVEDITVTHKNDAIHVAIKLIRTPCTCPICGATTDKVKDYTTKKILHSLTTNTPCYILYRARRYHCPVCHKAFYEHNPFSYKNMKISVLTVSNVLQDLKSANETFTTVAKRYSLSDTPVASIFDNHVYCTRKKLPPYLVIDEVYAFDNGNSEYVCVLLDFLTGNIIDVLPSRRKEDLLKYFREIPIEERRNVQFIISDMWETYRSVGTTVLPNCKHVADKFHLFQELGRCITSIRIRTMNQYKESRNPKARETMTIEEIAADNVKKDNYYLLKKFSWLLLKNKDALHKTTDELGNTITLSLFDPNMKRKFNRQLQRYLNFYDIYDCLLTINEELETTMNLKYKFDVMYSDSTRESIKRDIEELIMDFKNSGITEMVQFASTLTRWKKSIIHSFTKVNKYGKEVYMNSSLIENRNRTIKQLKNNSNGYKNWARYRNRIIYVLNDDATYYLNPIIRKKPLK